MRQVIPDYYPQFSCVGGACEHNCCIGWEIDIDADSAAAYACVGGALGQKLRESIVTDGCPHFRLTEGERCPFLNGENLCELILTLGEDSLCQICADHPRFYNEWSDRTEAGVGLCCPEAARLILTQREPVALLDAGDDGEEADALTDDEEALLALRSELLTCLGDQSRALRERFREMLARVGLTDGPEDFAAWARFYRTLERMDSAWDIVLDRMEKLPQREQSDARETALMQLASYLLYRHLFGALEDGRIAARVRLAVHAARLLASLADDVPQLCELARLYSAEIEYSEENLTAVLEKLEELP